MGNVYALDKDKNLILYSTGQYVCLRTCSGEKIARPVILANDYMDNLSDVIYMGTVYYCYKNTQSDIVIKSITDMNELYKLSSQDTPDCFLPRLVMLKDMLLLFYFVKNPVNDLYCLKCLVPFDSQKSLVINQSYNTLPQFSTISDHEHVILHISNTDTSVIFSIDDKLIITELVSSHAVAQNDNKKLTQLANEIKKRDDIIKSIKSQYEELMVTATKYRDEAVKWHDYVINMPFSGSDN